MTKTNRKKPKITTFKLNRDFNKVLDKIIASGISLEVGLGKYSCHIITKNDKAKYKFITNMQSKKTFIGYAKILSDLKREEISVLISDMEDNVSEKNNVYFEMGRYETKQYDNAVCVDLNSAYLQAMYNLSLIRLETKAWIETNLSKKERLVAVGMLAKQKEILEFSKGKITVDHKEVSKHRFIFNAIIQEVSRVMHQVQSHFMEDFIAYWVDGIYLKNEWIAIDVKLMFEAAGFPCKIEYLTDFKSEFKFTYMDYSYYKDGDFKILNIPVKEVQESMRRNLVASINSKRIEQRLDAIDTSRYVEKSKYYSQADLFD
jgi:hypothetical protein